QVRVVAGSVNETLATRLIKPYEPDLIVCGERGLTNFQYAFMGSTSKYLIRTQDCDVLVVKE
ncbi:MAG: universal stress protein, partial [Eggerthellaceae bacterium]|nr:universal stress protein [Eggerthellaceae bacterium]